MNTLYKKNLLRLINYTHIEIINLLKFASNLKSLKQKKQEIPLLNKKNIILIFEKKSTRTRCSFELAAFHQGANITYLGPESNQMHHKESIKDTAKFLGTLYDAIQYRGDHNTIEILAKHSNIPVWNGLTNKFHPTQILADLLTIQEFSPDKKFNQIKLTYLGDTKNNIANSLLEASALTGINLYLIGPKLYWPDIKLFKYCRKLSQTLGGNIVISDKITDYIPNTDYIYTDVWIYPHETQQTWIKKINLLKNYQINQNIINIANNNNIKFLHCLPSLHDDKTIISQKIKKLYPFLNNGIEVTNDIFESNNYSIVFHQAENRLHTIKAMILMTLIKNLKI